MQFRRYILLAAIAGSLAVLTIGVAFQFFSQRDLSAGDISATRAVRHLEGKIPVYVRGWIGKDEPLGATERLKGEVAALLNYDAVFYRIFYRGGDRIGVYVAYWARNRMAVSRVSSHTPDRCWTENGWRCEWMNFNEQWNYGGISLQPAQRRVFIAPSGGRENVVFWHIVDGRAYDFGDRFTQFTHPGKWLRDTIAYAALGSAEQYFIRLTSNRPFEELKSDTGFQEILRALAGLGLAVPQAKADGGGR